MKPVTQECQLSGVGLESSCTALRSLDLLCERLAAHGAAVRGPERHDGGDRSLYVEDPEGNVVEVWDFFARRRPIEALSD